jgi:8-oxo-dGTP pyrophosphatase MutT (NUDIX family)
MCNLCTSTLTTHARPVIRARLYPHSHERARKSGVCVYSSKHRAVLLIQSCFKYFGLPKGTVEKGETLPCCASRELFEEACIYVPPEVVAQCRRTCVGNLTMYLLDIDNCAYPLGGARTSVPTDEGTVLLPGCLPPLDGVNDSTGFMWINCECLRRKIAARQIVTSNHVSRILDILEKKSK